MIKLCLGLWCWKNVDQTVSSIQIVQEEIGCSLEKEYVCVVCDSLSGGHSSVLGMIGLKAIAVFYHHDIWWYKIQVVHGLIAVFLCLLYTNQRTNIRTTSNTSSWGWLTTNPLSVRWPWKDRWLADSPWLKRGCWWSRVALNPNMRLAVVSVRRNLPIYRFTKFTIARRAFSP